MTLAFITPEEWQAVWLSIRVAIACVVIELPIAIALGYVLARKQFIGRGLINALIHLPLVLPPVVVGYVLLITLGTGFNELFGIRIAFTWWAAVIAAAVMSLPLMVRPIRLAIESIDTNTEKAAATLGASPWRVLRTVTLPLAAPGILIGIVLAFARSLGEFGATIIFAGNISGETRTLPSAIYTAIQSPGGDAAAIRLVVLSIAISIASMIAAEILARRARNLTGASDD